MKLKNGFIKITVKGVPYLFPCGQNIADHVRSVCFNETGALLINALYEGADEEELLTLMQQTYDAKETDQNVLKEDLSRYLHQLFQSGILEHPSPQPAACSDLPCFRIGSLTFAWQGPQQFFEQYFAAFSCGFCGSAVEPDQLIALHYGRPHCRRNGLILVRNEELMICDSEEDYLFLFSDHWTVFEMHVKKDGSSALLYCDPAFMEKDTAAVFHAIRFAVLVLAQNRGLFVLHSASILYRDRAWLFSGSSGTGKSTHANLWHEIYQTPVLNGDLNMLGWENGVPTVYGLPWCGTSNIYTNETYPLGGVVFLKQAPYNRVFVPSPDAKVQYLAQRLISPSWTEELLLKNIRFAEEFTEDIPVFRLLCTKDADAASVIKSAVDQI